MSDLLSHHDESHPLTILRQQASLLGSKTDDVVMAKILVNEEYIDPPQYDFFLIALALDNFHKRLFSIEYKKPYPVFFDFRNEKKLEQELRDKLGEWKWGLAAKSEEEFESILTVIFHSDRTKHIIGSLMTLSDEFVSG